MKGLLPLLRQAFPSANTYDTITTVVQANAKGHRVVVDDQQDVFVKQVDAADYSSTKKDWYDFRRTLLYLRTEVRFYREWIPVLERRGFDAAPTLYHATYDLEGLIAEEEQAVDQSRPVPAEWWSAEGKGGSIIMASIGEPYFQDSPITLDQAKETLSAVATLHASAWEDAELLQRAETSLSRGSYHLKTRNVKELAEMDEAWEHFKSHFEHFDPALFAEIPTLGRRIQMLAEYISEEVSPAPTDPYATISHGDFKSMNCFLPGSASAGVKLVDFASTGVGLGMSDVAMHIHHAVLPEHLSNGGEEALVEHYWNTLNDLLGPERSYPRDAAMRHYRLAVADYFRFFLGRFWKNATPETFAKKKNSKNTALINRNVDSALEFLKRVNRYVNEIEQEKAASDAAAQIC